MTDTTVLLENVSSPSIAVELLLSNGFRPFSGLVRRKDSATVEKIIETADIDDVQSGITRLNSLIPDYITSYELVFNGDYVKLCMPVYSGKSPNQLTQKSEVVALIIECIDFIKRAQPYEVSDFNSNNIFIGDRVHFVDLDDVFYGRTNLHSPYTYYKRMKWAHKQVSFSEFEELWKEHF